MGAGEQGVGGWGLMMLIRDVMIQKPPFPYLNKAGRLLKPLFFNFRGRERISYSFDLCGMSLINADRGCQSW